MTRSRFEEAALREQAGEVVPRDRRRDLLHLLPDQVERFGRGDQSLTLGAESAAPAPPTQLEEPQAAQAEHPQARAADKGR